MGLSVIDWEEVDDGQLTQFIAADLEDSFAAALSILEYQKKTRMSKVFHRRFQEFILLRINGWFDNHLDLETGFQFQRTIQLDIKSIE